MLNWQRYDKSVDVWSFACIFAEMLIGKKTPLFPGADHLDQFSWFSKLLGNPPVDVVDGISSENTLEFVKSLKHVDAPSLEVQFVGCDPVGSIL